LREKPEIQNKKSKSHAGLAFFISKYRLLNYEFLRRKRITITAMTAMARAAAIRAVSGFAVINTAVGPSAPPIIPIEAASSISQQGHSGSFIQRKQIRTPFFSLLKLQEKQPGKNAGLLALL
jgi:hypothetical protein